MPRDTNPIFEQLFACSWRDVDFPVSSVRVSLRQDLVEHKYWGVDAADVESTGRAPLEIEATIPFVNGIVPGKNERWGVLYPTEFGRFVKAFNDRSAGLLTTPDIANLSCKPASLEYAHDAQQRDGVVVTAKWIETVLPDYEKIIARFDYGQAQLAALDLDAAAPTLQHQETAASSSASTQRGERTPFVPAKVQSFEQMMNGLTGVVDTTASRISILLNKPAQILYRVKRLQDSIERADDVLSWSAKESCERIKEALGPPASGKGDRLAAQPTIARRPVGRYRAPTRMTLSLLQGRLSNNTVDDLIFLNPSLVARPSVPSGAVVRYYL